MSIKPVDFQVMIPKAPEVSKIHEEGHQKNLVLQQQTTAATHQKAENNLKQVYSQGKAHEARISEKQEKQRENRKEKKEKEQEQNDQDPNKRNKEKSIQISTIDIKI